MTYLASICERRYSVFKFWQLVWLCSLLRYKKTQQNLFFPNQPRTSSLHILVKFELKIDLFWNISLFYRNNAFYSICTNLRFLSYSYPSAHSSLGYHCAVYWNLRSVFKTRLAWHPESFLFVSSCSPPSLSNSSQNNVRQWSASLSPVCFFVQYHRRHNCFEHIWLMRKVLQALVCLSQVLIFFVRLQTSIWLYEECPCMYIHLYCKCTFMFSQVRSINIKACLSQ